MLKFSEGVNLAVHALAYLAAHPKDVKSAVEMADRLAVSKDHLKKVLQRLARVGLVRSQRGPNGGFLLSRPPETVGLLEIVEALEGPWRVPHCVLGGHICGGACRLHGVTSEVHETLRARLSQTTLADVALRLPSGPS